MAVCAECVQMVFLSMAVFISGAAGASLDGAVSTDSGTLSWAVIGSVALAICLIALIMYCADTKVNTGAPPPPWVQNLVIHPSLANSGFHSSSAGVTIQGPTSVVRHRTGHFESDGARWSEGLTSGKHIFEFYWPAKMRGQSATVGVGSIDAPLHMKPRGSLIGSNQKSWGLDISRRRIMHNDEIMHACPKAGFVPDKFFMYVDADSGCVAYGTETAYWGVQIQGINRSHFPIYVMIGTESANANIQAFYRGSASEVTGGTDPTGKKPQAQTNVSVTVVSSGQDNAAGGAGMPPPPPSYEDIDDEKAEPQQEKV